MQSRPPNAGNGLVQLRCLCDIPVRQVVLHGDQLLNEDQPPFTGRQLNGWLLKIRTSYRVNRQYIFNVKRQNDVKLTGLKQNEILSTRGDILLRRGGARFALQGGRYVLHVLISLHLADGSVTDESFIQRKHPISTESGDYFISIFTLHFLNITEITLFHCTDISLYCVGICLFIM